MLLALIGEAQHDPQMARTFHERYLARQRHSERDISSGGVTTGDLSTKLGIYATLDALCGPILYRALTGTPIPRTFIDKLITDNLERDGA